MENSKELTEEEKRVAEARGGLRLWWRMGLRGSSDVPRLMELMRAYQVVGDFM